MRIILLALIFFTSLAPASAGLGRVLKLFDLKSENEYKGQNIARPNKVDKLKVVFISQANLYLDQVKNFQIPQLESLDSFSPYTNEFVEEPFFKVLMPQAQEMLKKPLVAAPDENSKIIFKQSQLLLQEAIREIVMSIEEEPVDMVIFTGNSVYSNNQFDFFIDILDDLDKFRISHYELIGPNELKGSKKIERYIEDKFYLLKTKNTNFLVLNNVDDVVIPNKIPEEANEQYIWLKTTLLELSENEAFNDTIILSYYPLSQRTLKLINRFDKIKLKFVLNSNKGEIKLDEDSKFLFKHSSEPKVLDLPSLSWYPCAYTIMTRDEFGKFHIEEKQVDLKDIQKLAREKLTKD